MKPCDIMISVADFTPNRLIKPATPSFDATESHLTVLSPSLQTHSTPSLAQSIDVTRGGDDVFLQPVPILSTVKGEATASGLVFPPPPPAPPSPLIVETSSDVSMKDSSKQSLSRSSTPAGSKLSVHKGTGSKTQLKKTTTTSQSSLRKMTEKAAKEKADLKSVDDDAGAQYCKTGKYVIIVSDVTEPPFLNERLEPAYLLVKVTKEKKSRKLGHKPGSRLGAGSRASVF